MCKPGALHQDGKVTQNEESQREQILGDLGVGGDAEIPKIRDHTSWGWYMQMPW